jgi:hypothetical protein
LNSIFQGSRISFRFLYFCEECYYFQKLVGVVIFTKVRGPFRSLDFCKNYYILPLIFGSNISLNCMAYLSHFLLLAVFLISLHTPVKSYVVKWPYRKHRRVTPMIIPRPCPSGSRLLRTFLKSHIFQFQSNFMSNLKV